MISPNTAVNKYEKWSNNHQNKDSLNSPIEVEGGSGSVSQTRSTANIKQLTSKMANISKLDIWALGITVVIGGQYFCWNFGLIAGFGSFLIITILMGTAYTCQCLCTSELSSALPFAGGAYGFARCTLGYYLGFMVGCCETIQYITYVSASALSLGSMISTLAPAIAGYEPITWLIFYITALVIYIAGGSIFWRFSTAMGVLSMLILLIFCFGSMPWVDLRTNGPLNGAWFVGGMSKFMYVYPLAAWFFVGVETLNLCCDDIEDPKTNIPQGQIACILTLVATSILVLFVSSALPPGLASLATQGAPLNGGFSLMFKIDPTAATAFSIPATYATAFGFIFAYSKLIVAMSASKLLPQWLNRRIGANQTPYLAMITGSIVGYCICLLAYFVPMVTTRLFNICILSAFCSYTAQCIGYIMLQTKFQNLSREFRSPLGIAGACFPMVVWGIGAIAIVAFQQDDQFALIVFVCICTTLSVYYFCVAQKKQTFSEQEKTILFKAHVVNYNTDKNSRGRRARAPGPEKKSFLFSSQTGEESVSSGAAFLMRSGVGYALGMFRFNPGGSSKVGASSNGSDVVHNESSVREKPSSRMVTASSGAGAGAGVQIGSWTTGVSAVVAPMGTAEEEAMVRRFSSMNSREDSKASEAEGADWVKAAVAGAGDGDSLPIFTKSSTTAKGVPPTNTNTLTKATSTKDAAVEEGPRAMAGDLCIEDAAEEDDEGRVFVV